MRRRVLTAATVALLGLPLAACSAGVPAADPPASAGVSPAAPTAEPAPERLAAPAARPAPPPGGRGWTARDLPVFPPAPAAEPIDLPRSGSVPYLSRIPTR